MRNQSAETTKAGERTRKAKSLSLRIAEGFDKGSTSTAHLRDIELCDAAGELLRAAKKTKAFIDDLSKSNPGFLGKLVLQDYAQFNEAMIELPRAIAKAEGK